MHACPCAVLCCAQAPDYYDEIQMHLASGPEPSAAGGKSKESSVGDVWWDIGGWLLLGAVVTGALFLARSNPPKPAA